MHVLVAAMLVTACSSPTPQTSAEPATSVLRVVAGDTRSISGIKYIDVAVGTGTEAARLKCLYTEYTGWLANGQKIDSSHDPMPDGRPGEPAAFVLGSGAVMPGWELGFGGMRVGGKRRLFIPYAMAYGERGRPPQVPARTALVFDVELVAVMAPGRGTGTASSGECPPLRR